MCFVEAVLSVWFMYYVADCMRSIGVFNFDTGKCMRLEAFLSLVSHAVLSLYVTSVESSVHLFHFENGKEENLLHHMCYVHLPVHLEKLCVFGIIYIPEH